LNYRKPAVRIITGVTILLAAAASRFVTRNHRWNSPQIQGLVLFLDLHGFKHVTDLHSLVEARTYLGGELDEVGHA
jgi:hypothetical protein